MVQRIQRYAQSSVFKRSVLQGMAHELLSSSSSMPENLRQVACPLDNSQGRSGSRPVLAAPCNSPLNAILAMLIDGKEQVCVLASLLCPLPCSLTLHLQPAGLPACRPC